MFHINLENPYDDLRFITKNIVRKFLVLIVKYTIVMEVCLKTPYEDSWNLLCLFGVVLVFAFFDSQHFLARRLVVKKFFLCLCFSLLLSTEYEHPTDFKVLQTNWKLYIFNLNGEFIGLNDSENEILLNITEKGFDGNLGCNTITGTYKTQNNKLHFKNINTTKRLCDSQSMKIEGFLLRFFKNSLNFSIKNNELVLEKDSAIAVFKNTKS